MDYPTWKTALSYLVDIPLKKWATGENGEMKLALSRGSLKLSTQNAVYSFGRHYRSFAQAFDVLKVREDHSIEEVLVLGWGIGSIAELLEGHPKITTVTGVEHDPSLISLYRELHSGYRFETPLICADALEIVHGLEQRFDLICSDIFTDNTTPDQVVAPGYLRALNGLLKPGGKVLLSKLNMTAGDRKQNKVLEENLRDLDFEYDVANTIGNRIYFWKRK